MVDREDLVARLQQAIDRRSDRPLSRQIADAVWTEVIDGTLATGDRLPTARLIAIQLQVHPRVVERALAELQRRGVVRVEPGGVFVALTDTDIDDRDRAAKLEALCHETALRGEALGFAIDDVIEMLADLRLDRSARRRE